MPRKRGRPSRADKQQQKQREAAEVVAASRKLVRVTSREMRRRACVMVDAALAQDAAWPFSAPVDTSTEPLAHYFSIVRQPMDLGTVKNKLRTHQYQSTAELMSDIRLIWHNALLFNSKTTEIYGYALTLGSYVEWFYSNVIECATVVDEQSPAENGLVRGREMPDMCKLPNVIPILKSDPPENPVSESLCGVCEREGSFVLCDGPCLRSFHLSCIGLDELPEEDEWFCNDCASNKHPCFLCGKEGVAGADVHKCEHKACGKFYHMFCMMEDDRFKRNGRGAQMTFTCPRHYCQKCKLEVHTDLLTQCTRCVTAYHFGCLPEIDQSGMKPRTVYLSNHHFMVCPEHENKIRVKGDIEGSELPVLFHDEHGPGTNAFSSASFGADDAIDGEPEDPYALKYALDHLKVLPVTPTVWTGYEPRLKVPTRRSMLEVLGNRFLVVCNESIARDVEM